MCLLWRLIIYCVHTEAIPIPPDQPIMQIKDMEDVIIPTMEIKVRIIASMPLDIVHCCAPLIFGKRVVGSPRHYLLPSC